VGATLASMDALQWLAFPMLLAGACAGIRGVALLRRGLRGADDTRGPLWVIRGIRGIAVAASAAVLAVGILGEQRGLLALGAVFLAEELYETAVVALLLRRGLRDRRRSPVIRTGPRQSGTCKARTPSARVETRGDGQFIDGVDRGTGRSTYYGARGSTRTAERGTG
jgi:hypothetical protein